MGGIDLRVFKGVFYDIDEIGLALAQERPGLEPLTRAVKAALRLRGFLDTVPEPNIGLYSALLSIERCLTRQGRSPKLFDEHGVADLAGKVAEARGDLKRLREYCEGLKRAWQVCALDYRQADRQAARR
jgi:hypothetical protein